MINKEIHRLIEDVWAKSLYNFDHVRFEQELGILIDKQLEEYKPSIIVKSLTSEEIIQLQKQTHEDRLVNESISNKLIDQINEFRGSLTNFYTNLDKELDNMIHETRVYTSIQSPEELTSWLCNEYLTSVKKVKSQNRHNPMMIVRRMHCYISKTLWEYKFSLAQIGNAINRDHANVLHLFRVVENDVKWKIEAENLIKRLKTLKLI